MSTIELSKERIAKEIGAVEDAARKLDPGRKDALGFLQRIGADGWPNSPTKRNGAESSRRKRA
jgi:hypothetical protein